MAANARIAQSREDADLRRVTRGEGKRGQQGQSRATDARREARDVPASQPAPEIEGDCLETAVIEMQIDNIHLELDIQTHRTAQLEVLVRGVRDEVRELTELVKWLRDEVLSHSASGHCAPREVVH
jgi:hypothetical protein